MFTLKGLTAILLTLFTVIDSATLCDTVDLT